MVEIRRRLSRKALYEGPEGNVKDLAERLVKEEKSLYGADLQGADLRGADLRGADLRGADLRRAHLQRADLREADLGGADLFGAYLGGADLREADLGGADIFGAYLGGADLFRADLFRADLRGSLLNGADLRGSLLGEADLRGSLLVGADLQEADLRRSLLGGADLFRAHLQRADLREADLRRSLLGGADFRGSLLGGTILDPENRPNQKGLSEFKRTKNGRCIGYRTRKSSHVGSRVYKDRGTYTAPVFSTCEETDCHPGLYLWPTLEMAQNWAIRLGLWHLEIVKVTFDPEDLHGIGDKWRVRRFTVVGKAQNV